MATMEPVEDGEGIRGVEYLYEVTLSLTVRAIDARTAMYKAREDIKTGRWVDVGAEVRKVAQ